MKGKFITFEGPEGAGKTNTNQAGSPIFAKAAGSLPGGAGTRGDHHRGSCAGNFARSRPERDEMEDRGVVVCLFPCPACQ